MSNGNNRHGVPFPDLLQRRYADKGTASTDAPAHGHSSGDHLMGHSILLIEDEAAIADTLVYALGSEGFHVHWHRLGQEGIACLESEPIDLVILDIGLPDEDGFALCRRIRQRWELPIIFLTARKEEVDRVVGLEIGADDYVTKPFSPRELAARVKAILRRIGSNAQETNQDGDHPVQAGPFLIDDGRKRIRFRDQWLELTPCEYRILQALASRPEQVFSRDALMDQAWDNPDHSFDRAVDTHIKTLRSKLRRIDPDSNPIRTHRGLGYSVCLE